MKKIKKGTLNLTVIFIAFALVFISCSDDDTTNGLSTISADDAKAMIQLENVSDQVNNLLDDYYVFEWITARTDQQAKSSEACWAKTVVLDTQNQIVTLDFADGCTLNSGDIIKCKIIVTYTIDFSSQSFEVNYTYEDFYLNDLSVTGNNKIVGVRENVNGKPQSVLSVDEKITWTSGDYAMRKGTKTREFTEGNGTRTYSDNVFLITGSWTDTFNNGTVIKGTVTESLKREMTCKHYVNGKLKLEKNQPYGTLDFGDGTCDSSAVFRLSNGTEIDINL